MILLFALILLPITACGQTEQVQGLHKNSVAVHAFTNSTIVMAPDEVYEDATLVIRSGVIDEVGPDVQPPADARIWNMKGKTLYPGFIDPHSTIGMSEPRVELDRGAISWNPQIRSQLTAAEEFSPADSAIQVLREQGFTTAMSVPDLGIFRGESAVFSLGNGAVSDLVIHSDVAQSVSLRRSVEFGVSYPTSPMGAIALIRQTLHDADWYERVHSRYESDPQGLERPESNAALRALRDAVRGNQPLLFEALDEEEILRILRLTDEFRIIPWIRGSGHEYRILDVLANTTVPLILPLTFPETPDVQSPENALNQNLSTLRQWYNAPENPARVANEGITFSFTANGLEHYTDFLPNLRKAVRLGLDPETALAALTVNPANLLGINDTHGTLESGKAANIMVADGNIFEPDTKVLDVWVDGKRFRVNSLLENDPRGKWQVIAADREATLVIEGTPDRLKGTIAIENREIELSSVSIQDQARRFRAEFKGNDLDIDGRVRLTASISGDELYGWAETPEMERVQWYAKRIVSASDLDEQEENPEIRIRDLRLADIRPDMEYGRSQIPRRPENIIIRNATIWTMGPEGILEEADLFVSRGKVIQVGSNLEAPDNAVEIDATRKHVTPGLIDPHLHSGTDGVNEVGNAVVPEVRMGDVLTINNIWMYRQLAGGLTTAHVMHGSANPIGGQNQHLKMRWGQLSDDLKFEGAPATVKFALGENVKRVGTDRYPETRMGTQQIIADHFRAARDYQERWNNWEQTGTGLPPRRDLRMDALVDILEGDILIQSHSYRQDEILMLTRLAEEFNIQIKAFHHGVEAYKLAPELAEHRAGAVVWSDWSSFKIEAYDATIYNARLLTEAGVLTSLHSDNSQIASRMNWEAAKMVHAGMEPEEALSLVTINTAKLLGIDNHVGSLEPGKDADFVIWNGDPLSTFTKAEQTWIDGRKYFDLEEDTEMRRAIERERSQLIQLILEEE